MGATTFTTRARGKSADEAFKLAREEAQYQHGHGGYTGTLAEKHGYRLVTVPPGYAHDPNKPGWPPETKESREAQYAQLLLETDDHWVNDKWGPAACIMLQDGSYLFFGWASC